jgi:hypothetical protein
MQQCKGEYIALCEGMITGQIPLKKCKKKQVDFSGEE